MLSSKKSISFILGVLFSIHALLAQEPAIHIAGYADHSTIATDDYGRIHIVYYSTLHKRGFYIYGEDYENLEEPVEIPNSIDLANPRIDVDAGGRAHVVFQRGKYSAATASWYTCFEEGSFIEPEKFADADSVGSSRAYLPDVAADSAGNVLVCFWKTGVNSDKAGYRWRDKNGVWGEYKGNLSSFHAATPKVAEYNNNFYLHYALNDYVKKIAGPNEFGTTFSEGIDLNSDDLNLNVQNEGVDFTFDGEGNITAAGNVRVTFEGPSGIWISTYYNGDFNPEFLGAFDGTVRGDESSIHPSVAIDDYDGSIYVSALNPNGNLAYYTAGKPGKWSPYRRLRPESNDNQGMVRDNPEVADIPGEGVIAIFRGGSDLFLRKLLVKDIMFDWKDKSTILKGRNFDAAVQNDTLVVISNGYVELNEFGNIIFNDNAMSDSGQSIYDFGPAISISHDGYVHIITRGSGNKENGFQLYYSSKKLGSNQWKYKKRIMPHFAPRNYIVDIDAIDSNRVYIACSAINDVVGYGVINIYQITDGVTDSLGFIGDDAIIRMDSDFRMKILNDTLYMATGKPDPLGKVYYMKAGLGDNLLSDLYASIAKIREGSWDQRKGQPDIAIDTSGTVHLIYGSKYVLYYHSFKSSVDFSGKMLFHKLNDWHLGIGLGAVNVSPDGKIIMAVALQTNNTKIADNSVLFYSMSADYGKTWTYQKSMAYKTHGGEGRIRPRVLASGNNFYTVFYDSDKDSITSVRMQLNKPYLPITPDISILPDGGTYSDTIEVSFNQSDECISFYNFSDDAPKINSNEYTGPLKLGNTTYLSTISYLPGYLPSGKSTYFDISITTNNVNQKASRLFMVYPNPVVENLYFSEKIDYQLYTLSGSLIDSGASKSVLSMKGLPAGSYIIKTKLDGRWDVNLIVKSK